jgi:hypothetical protein
VVVSSLSYCGPRLIGRGRSRLNSPQFLLLHLVPSRTMTSNSRDPAAMRLKQIAAHVRQPLRTDYPVPHYAGTSTSDRLKDKVAIITGCNSDKGIGRAAATTFAANGAKAVVICDLDDSNLRTWAEEIGKRYPNTTVEWRKFDASGLPISLCF